MDVVKADLYRELGYGGSLEPYDQLLTELGLSNPRKSGISLAKRPDVEAALAAQFIRVCNRGDCRSEAARDPRSPAPAVSQASCEICGGSANATAIDQMVAGFEHAGLGHLCVVGGAPNTRQEFGRLVAGRLELRLIDGARSHPKAQALANRAWADVLVIWGATQMDHKVSNLYPGADFTSAKRGIQDLANEIEWHVRKRAQRGN